MKLICWWISSKTGPLLTAASKPGPILSYRPWHCCLHWLWHAESCSVLQSGSEKGTIIPVPLEFPFALYFNKIEKFPNSKCCIFLTLLVLLSTQIRRLWIILLFFCLFFVWFFFLNYKDKIENVVCKIFFSSSTLISPLSWLIFNVYNYDVMQSHSSTNGALSHVCRIE